ncbi:hypothetical protein [Streptomyces malaysiensis]|uniref:hypothetical protein n=1 Tax=Streptomyces malaysiensis TaxID=92644 RepID=UPI000D1CBBC0|nr:hypothetical protein [Streptomyces malaysiensis]
MRDDPEAAPAAAPQKRERKAEQERTGIPAGPLALTLLNGAGLAATGTYAAAGMAGAVALGATTAAAGAVAAGAAIRGRRYGRYGHLGRLGRYGYGAGRWGLGGRRGGAGGYSGSAGWTLGGGRRGGGGGGAASGSSWTTGGGSAGRVRSPLLGKTGRRRAAETAAATGAAPGAVRGGGSASGRVSPATGSTSPGATGAQKGSGGPSAAEWRSGGTSGRGWLRRALSGARGALTGRQSHSGAAGQSVKAAEGRAGRRGLPDRLTTAGQATARRWRSGARGRRLWRQRLRMLRRITATTLLATTGAVLGQVLWPFRFTLARNWVRIWNWRAHRAQAKEARIDAKNEQKDRAEKRAPVKDTVNDPDREKDRINSSKKKTAAPAAEGGGGNVRVFLRAAEQVASAYGRYSPPNMLSVAAEYEGVPKGIRNAAMAISHLVRNTREVYAAHGAVAEAVSAVYMRMMEAAKTADEIAPHFRSVHKEDLTRHESPRNGHSGEAMWNIGGTPGNSGGRRDSVFARSSEQVATVYVKWFPKLMTQVAEEYESLPAGIECLANAVQSLAVQSADSYPVDPSVAEMVSTVRHRMMQAVSAAQDVMPVFRRVHATDLARHEAPRNGHAAEAMWNV